MLGPSIQDIKDYLVSSDLANKVACSNNTLCEKLSTFVTVAGIDSQMNLTAPSTVKTCWWIEYSDIDNVFTYKVAPFDNQYNPITYEEYAQHYQNKPGIVYDESKKITWVMSQQNAYNVQYTEFSRYATYMIENIPTILKVN